MFSGNIYFLICVWQILKKSYINVSKIYKINTFHPNQIISFKENLDRRKLEITVQNTCFKFKENNCIDLRLQLKAIIPHVIRASDIQ